MGNGVWSAGVGHGCREAGAGDVAQTRRLDHDLRRSPDLIACFRPTQASSSRLPVTLTTSTPAFLVVVMESGAGADGVMERSSGATSAAW